VLGVRNERDNRTQRMSESKRKSKKGKVASEQVVKQEQAAVEASAKASDTSLEEELEPAVIVPRPPPGGWFGRGEVGKVAQRVRAAQGSLPGPTQTQMTVQNLPQMDGVYDDDMLNAPAESSVHARPKRRSRELALETISLVAAEELAGSDVEATTPSAQPALPETPRSLDMSPMTTSSRSTSSQSTSSQSTSAIDDSTSLVETRMPAEDDAGETDVELAFAAKRNLKDIDALEVSPSVAAILRHIVLSNVKNKSLKALPKAKGRTNGTASSMRTTFTAKTGRRTPPLQGFKSRAAGLPKCKKTNATEVKPLQTAIKDEHLAEEHGEVAQGVTHKGSAVRFEKTDNEDIFFNDAMGGLGLALTHGSVLFEVARQETHCTTPLKEPDRRQPTRVGIVFYLHKSLQYSHHGCKALKRMAKKLNERDYLAYLTGHFVPTDTRRRIMSTTGMRQVQKKYSLKSNVIP
jgi:hypothetical protein